MRIHGIGIRSLFEKRYAKLPKRIKEMAKARERTFRINCFDPVLRTHKLHGKESESWAFWITYSYRIKFNFVQEGEALFLNVGTHDEVY